MESYKGVEDLCRRAAAVKSVLQELSSDCKNKVLLDAAQLLCDHESQILKANEKDMAAAREHSISEGMADRLKLTHERIEDIAEGLRQVAALPDPVGEEIERFRRPNGMLIRKVRVPFGVIAMIYESRPNVTADAFALCFKAGSAVILKGGSDALHSNTAIVRVLKEALVSNHVPADAIGLIESTDRADTRLLLQQRAYIDVVIPRGSAGLIRMVVENSEIPVIETGSGNCHIYVDKDADFDKAIPIIINAKTQRTGVCNAAESLVVHKDIADSFLPLLSEAMHEHGVRLHADEASIHLLPYAVPAVEEDYAAEYLSLQMSVKTVSSLDEAIEHINRYHTRHSDCIITENKESADRFLRLVDSACVYVNVSTRFTDGFQFGFGAEIGISTQKLHARGPMGLLEITTYKYLITGNGQVRP